MSEYECVFGYVCAYFTESQWSLCTITAYHCVCSTDI